MQTSKMQEKPAGVMRLVGAYPEEGSPHSGIPTEEGNGVL